MFAARIISHVNNNPAVPVDGQGCVFVAEAAQCGALDRFGLRIKGIKFNHPAKAVGLVRVSGQVKTLVVPKPFTIVFIVGIQPVSLLGRRE